MTPGNDGASTPEDDDPFGYLYADGQASGATPPTGGGYGYPGPRSYNRVRTVGERQYGQQAPAPQQGPGQGGQQGYGQQAQAPQQYNSPNPHYSAPETLAAGGGPPSQRSYDDYDRGRSRGRGPNTRGLLIGAVAVVAAVVIGIGIAVLSGGGEDDKAGGGDPSGDTTAGQTDEPSGEPTKDKPNKPAKLPKADAKSLRLGGGTVTASDIPGANADGGIYVAGLNQVGAKVTWTFSADKAGEHKLYVRYGIPGVDANATLLVNGKPNNQPLGMKNFTGSPEGDWEKGWQSTWAPVTVTKGTNVLEIVCAEGNQCNANIDKVWLK